MKRQNTSHFLNVDFVPRTIVCMVDFIFKCQLFQPILLAHIICSREGVCVCRGEEELQIHAALRALGSVASLPDLDSQFSR